MHPVNGGAGHWINAVEYSRYARSSRLAGRASAPSVRRRVHEMGSSLPQCVGDKRVVAVDDGEVNRLVRSQIIQIVCDGKGSRVSRGEALELAQILGPLPHVSRSVGRVYRRARAGAEETEP